MVTHGGHCRRSGPFEHRECARHGGAEYEALLFLPLTAYATAQREPSPAHFIELPKATS